MSESTHQPVEDNSPRMSSVVEVLVDQGCDDDLKPTLTSDQSGPRRKSKKKKNKGKKKKINSEDEDKAHEKSDEIEGENSNIDIPVRTYLSPFTSSSSAMQNKLKALYDELRKSHESDDVKLMQIVEFSKSLIDTRQDLQHRLEAFKRKFAIKKALLVKADRSSLDRLEREFSKLRLEKQRLDEDGSVHNYITEHFRQSQAYNKMLEIKTSIEEEIESSKLEEINYDDFSEISFEELLAQEKKDSFWQKNGISRSC